MPPARRPLTLPRPAAVAVAALALAPGVVPAAGTDRLTVTLLREDGTVDLGEAQGADPLSTTARTLLDDVLLPAHRLPLTARHRSDVGSR